MLLNIFIIPKNEKTFAGKKNIKVTYTQRLIFDCYGAVIKFKLTGINILFAHSIPFEG